MAKQADIKVSSGHIKTATSIEKFFSELDIHKKSAVFMNTKTASKLLKYIHRNTELSDDETSKQITKELSKYRVIILDKIKRNTLLVVS